MHSAHRGPGFHCGPAAPRSSGPSPVAGGGWDPLSQPQPPSSSLTPTPAASISAFQPRWPAQSNSLRVLPLEALTQKGCQAPGGPTAPPSPGRAWGGGSRSPGSSSPPSYGPRQLHTHRATRGGGIWSQCEVREPPPLPGRPAWSSVNHFMAGTGLGSGGRGLAQSPQSPLMRTDEPTP